MYDYDAHVVRVIDGDTVDVDIDCGFDITVRQRIRLEGLNAPEHGTIPGNMATAWLTEKLPVGIYVEVVTTKDKREKYGRYLGTIYSAGVNINEQLLAKGLAKPWDGTGARPV